MNEFYEFLTANQDSITTGTAQRLADELGFPMDFHAIP